MSSKLLSSTKSLLSKKKHFMSTLEKFIIWSKSYKLRKQKSESGRKKLTWTGNAGMIKFVKNMSRKLRC